MSSEKRVSVGESAPLERLLREALRRLASETMCERILERALADAGLAAPPQDPAEFGAFLCGPLHAIVETALGPDSADSIVVDLRPAFLVDAKGSPASGVRSRGRMSVPAPAPDATVVLVASSTPAEVDGLIPLLRERVKVVAAYDVFALLTAAQRYLTQPITLLLADSMPVDQRSTLATLGRVLPPGTRILTWGEGDTAPPWRAGMAAQVTWVHLGAVPLEAVAEACLATLAPPAPAPVASPTRVVVAHGDATWRHAAVRSLTAAGYEALPAPDGFMALERCIDESPAVVVAGVDMPTLDGVQLATLLEGRLGARAPRIVLVGEPVEGAVAACVVERAADDADLVALVASAVDQAPEN